MFIDHIKKIAARAQLRHRGPHAPAGTHASHAQTRHRGLGALTAALALGTAVFGASADAAARRPVIFVPGTMATAFNAPNSGSIFNPDTSRVWIDLEFSSPWDVLDDLEIKAHFRLKHLPGSSISVPMLDRHYGTTVSYIGSAAKGYFDGLVDDDIDVVADTIHVDLVNAFKARGYVLNQSLFALRYDWVQNWEGSGNACARLNSLVTEALSKSGGADKVFLVGHSQGTQVIDYCLTRGASAATLRGKTAGVVHFAPPNHGGDAHNLYANMATVGMGKEQSMHWAAKISDSTSREIMRTSPAMYMIRPDRIFEREIEETFPWIVGSFSEFNVHNVCTTFCTYFGGNTPPPVYAFHSQTQSVPSGPNLPWATRELQITDRLYDGILAQWSQDVKGDMNLSQFRYNLPQLVFRGTGISTAVNYSVHHHTYNILRPDFPMPLKSSSVVYSGGDGSVAWEGTGSPRTSGPYSIFTYQSNLSSTPGCDDREHVKMFFGSCAAEKVGRFVTWASGVGQFSGSALSQAQDAVLNTVADIGDEVESTLGKQTGWRNLSFFIPVDHTQARATDADTTRATLATLLLPTQDGPLMIGVAPHGGIAYVADATGRELDGSAASGRRVYAERVPSTSRGVDLVHIALQVPLSGTRALENADASLTLSDATRHVLVWSEDVDAATGASTRQAPSVHAIDATTTRSGEPLQFRIDEKGRVERR